MFDLLRGLKKAAGAADQQGSIKAAIDGLASYAVRHFAYEDRIMDSFDYDERAQHRRAHAAFAKQVAALGREASADSYGKLVDFIYDWLISHIDGTDRRMIAKLNGSHKELFSSHKVATQTHAVIDGAFAIAGQVVVRPMMYIALTYDHRLVDGREAVLFLRRIKELVENPVRMLIEI